MKLISCAIEKLGTHGLNYKFHNQYYDHDGGYCQPPKPILNEGVKA